MSRKRANGVYYTERSPFELAPFRQWAERAGIRGKVVLEPFAGANNIIHMLRRAGLAAASASFDIAPNDREVQQQDTLARFPQGYDICITNPPWLARNSATRRRLAFPPCRHDDLYKHCLELCLANCGHVGALIPASYLQSGLFLERLDTYILLHGRLFDDTENPTCLALFNPAASRDVNIYYDHHRIGGMSRLSQSQPVAGKDRPVRFNDPEGELGFVSFDSTREPSIQFCRAHQLAGYEVKHSSRFITRIGGTGGSTGALVKRLNRKVAEYREATKDVFLTPFKGLRADGMYRRRMDFALARRFINAH